MSAPAWAGRAETPQEFVQAIEERYPLTNAGRNTTPIVTTGQQTAVVISQITVSGREHVLSQNGQAGLAAALTSGGAIRLKAADIRDEDLRRIYAQAWHRASAQCPTWPRMPW